MPKPAIPPEKWVPEKAVGEPLEISFRRNSCRRDSWPAFGRSEPPEFLGVGPVLQGNVFSDDDGSGWSPGGPFEDFSPADYPPDVLLVYGYGSLYGGI